MPDGDSGLSQRELADAPAQPGPSARDKIVVAALRVLSERGSHEASIKEIAKAAGVAPGLVHYYFSSKGELILEVVRVACVSYRSEMSELSLPEDPLERTRALLSWTKQRGLAFSDWYRLLFDLDSMALRDAGLAREVTALKSEIREHTAELIGCVETQLGVSLGVSHQGLASVLVPALDGLILQRLLDPSFDLDAGFDALEKLLIALLRTAR